MPESSPPRALPMPQSRRPSRRRPGGRRPLAVAAVAVLAATGLTACGPGRSVESYCGVMEEHKERFVSATQDVGSADPLSGLTSLVLAYGDLNSMWEEAAKVAPEEIQIDVETVRDAWASQKETAEEMVDNPLKGLASGLMTGITSAAATQRVDEYTATQCPEVGGMFLADGGAAVPSDGTGSGAPADGSTPTNGMGSEVGATPEPDDGLHPSPERTWTAFGPMWTHGTAEDSALSGPSVFFVPEIGEVEVSAGELLGSTEVLDEQYQYFPDGDEPRLAGLITVRVPSSGLDPEGFVTSVVSLDLGSGVAEVAERIDGEQLPEQPSVTLAGTAADNVVVVENIHGGDDGDGYGTWDDGDGIDLTAFDLSTGEQVWHRAGANLQRHGALRFAWMTSPSWSHSGGCMDRPYHEDGTIRPVTYEWTDLGTGAPAFSMPLMVDGEDGVVCRDLRETISPRFSMVERWNGDLYETEAVYVLDHETQETPPVPGPIDLADPVGTAGLLHYNTPRTDDTEPSDLLVVDLATGAEMYRMERDRAEALDLSVQVLFDGILYLSTTDENVAVDVATGEELGAWTVYPESRVGTYTLLSDGTLHEDWIFTRE